MRRLPRPDLGFHEGHAGQLDLDDHLVRTWRGFCHLGGLEHLRRAELPHDYGTHTAPPSLE